ncbi:MAG: hypothetical protein QW390_04245 [Candidatus Bathyarchaeia archaeon]
MLPGSYLSEGGTRVLEKRRVPGEGLRLVLSQRVNFPRPIMVYNPKTIWMEERSSLDVLFDASIPEEQMAVYEGFSPGREAGDRIVLLLAALGYSYPTSAISEVTGVAHSTTCRLLWQLKRDGLLAGAFSGGSYVNGDVWPYRYGPLREAYWMLTPRGSEHAQQLMRLRVVPLALQREAAKEKAEHPWLTPVQAERVAREHMEETRRRMAEIRAKQARGDELTVEELRIVYGEKPVREEEQKELERVERPWDAAARRAEEARRRYLKG